MPVAVTMNKNTRSILTLQIFSKQLAAMVSALHNHCSLSRVSLWQGGTSGRQEQSESAWQLA